MIEDSAQAIGAMQNGFKAGSLGIINSFSLHPLKNLNAVGDAGIVTTNDDALAEKLMRIRNHGMIDRDNIPEFGYNARLDTVQAVILNVKFPHLASVVERRRKNAAFYQAKLKGLVEIPVDSKNAYDVYHLFVIQCDKRDALKEYLAKHEIYTSIHYPTPIHLFECSRKLGYKLGDFPETERQSKRILSLPIHQTLKEEQLTFVCEKITEFYKLNQ